MSLIQILAIGILALLVVFSFYDLKRAVLMWLPFQLLFNNQIAVRYESPGIALVVAGNIALFASFFLQRKKKHDYYSGPFPFFPPLILIAFSYLISLAFTIAPLSTALVATVKYFVGGFGMLYLAHRVFNNLSDIRLYVKCCIIVSLLIVALAISENVLHTNLWLDFVYYNSPFDPDSGRMFYSPGNMEIRYGLVRSRSFFSFHVPFGVACVCFYWLLFYCYRHVKGSPSEKACLFVCSFLLIGGVLMSNSKQAYVGLFLMVLSLYPLKTVLNPKIVFPVLAALVLAIIYVPEYFNNILSLSDQNLAEEGGGSTIALRESQFDVAIQMFEQSPFIGNGIASIGVLKAHQGFDQILGAESVWLRILPERGLLGAVSYVFLYLYMWRLRTHINERVLFFFLLSIFVIETAGGQKDMSLWGVVLLAVYRYNEILDRQKLLCSKQRLPS